MNAVDFIKDKLLLLLLHAVCMIALAAFLRLTNYPDYYICLIGICWALAVSLWFLAEYLARKKYFSQSRQILDSLDKKYLLGGLLPHSFRLEDQLYQDMIRRSNKSVIERIHEIEEQQKDYREYIESWVHEMKAPITSVCLSCEKGKDMRTRRISQQMQKIENYVDMALYYARSDAVYKDYMIKKACLQKTAEEVVCKNKYYLIQNGVQVQVDCMDSVYTDVKWIAFILNQLVLNAVKYKSGSHPHLWIYTEKWEGGVRLSVLDNGIGIEDDEKERIFEKGFTGRNGRKYKQATGMGLYLCKKLCLKLGIHIYARPGKEADRCHGNGNLDGIPFQGDFTGTEMILEFPVSRYQIRSH